MDTSQQRTHRDGPYSVRLREFPLYMCTCIYNMHHMDNMYHMDDMYHMLCIYLTGNESGGLTRVLIGSDESFESSNSIFPRK